MTDQCDYWTNRAKAAEARVAELEAVINALANLAAEHLNCSGCPTPWWLTNWLHSEAASRALTEKADGRG